MYKYINYAKAFCGVLAMMLLVCACGGSTRTASSPAQAPMQNQTASYEESYISYDMEQESASYVTDSSKKIKNGSMEMVSTEFDNFMVEIKNIVTENNGYIETSQITTSTVNTAALRNGYYNIRIPAENYEAVKDYIMTLGEVIDFYDSVIDVSTKYNDIESRLITKRAEETRLLEFIDSADKIEDIIILEQRLGEVRTNIELYETRLTDIDRHVSYSTLTVNISEKIGAAIAPLSNNLGQRMSEGFGASFNSVVSFFEAMFIGISYISIPLIVIGILVFVGVFVYRKTIKSKLDKKIL